MRFVVLCLAAALAAAQTTSDDARALLLDVAARSQKARTWSVEGVQQSSISGEGIDVRSEDRFQFAYEPPSKMRLEIGGTETVSGMGPFPSATRIVCDGVDHWTHNPPATSFSRSPVTVSACLPAFGDYSNLGENLVSAAIVGRDHIPFSGATRECVVVRAEYFVRARSIRTLCIDPAQHLVLRDTVETESGARKFVHTTTYTTFTRGAALPPDLFRFDVPTGAIEDEGPQMLGTPVPYPTLISKTEPSSTPEARAAGIAGIVLVSLHVSREGIPGDIKVVRGLGHGLDEKAVEAVRRWRFSTAATPKTITIAVNFP